MAQKLTSVNILENVWLLIGLKLSPVSCFARIVNHILRFDAIGIIFYLLCYSIHWTFKNDRGGDRFYLISDISYVYLYLIVLIGLIRHSRKRRAILRYQRLLLKSVDTNELSKINRFGYELLIFGLFASIGHMMSLLIYSLSRPAWVVVRNNIGFNVSDDVRVQTLIASYMIVGVFKGMSLFLVLCAIYYLLHLFILKEIAIKFYRNTSLIQISSAHYLKIAYHNQKLHNCFNDFESLFSFYPFVWTSFLFLKSSAIFMFLILARNDTLVYTIYELLGYLAHVLIFGFVLMKTIQFSEQIEHEKSILVKRLEISFNKDSSLGQLIESIRESKYLFTVWQIVPINRSFIFQYLSTLTSFSALFSNLAQIN